MRAAGKPMPAVKAVFLMDKGMGIIDTYIGSFRNFDDFEGRSSRAEFWMIGAVLQVVFFVVLIVPSISLVIRRLHDTGTSGWFLLMLFLPLFNFLVLCLLLFYRSDPYDNGYGPPGNSPQKTVPDPS